MEIARARAISSAAGVERGPSQACVTTTGSMRDYVASFTATSPLAVRLMHEHEKPMLVKKEIELRESSIYIILITKPFHQVNLLKELSDYRTCLEPSKQCIFAIVKLASQMAENMLLIANFCDENKRNILRQCNPNLDFELRENPQMISYVKKFYRCDILRKCYFLIEKIAAAPIVDILNEKRKLAINKSFHSALVGIMVYMKKYFIQVLNGLPSIGIVNSNQIEIPEEGFSFMVNAECHITDDVYILWEPASNEENHNLPATYDDVTASLENAVNKFNGIHTLLDEGVIYSSAVSQ